MISLPKKVICKRLYTVNKNLSTIFSQPKIKIHNSVLSDRKKITEKSPLQKNFLAYFSSEVEKPSAEISCENKNCGFPQKCRNLKAL